MEERTTSYELSMLRMADEVNSKTIERLFDKYDLIYMDLADELGITYPTLRYHLDKGKPSEKHQPGIIRFLIRELESNGRKPKSQKTTSDMSEKQPDQEFPEDNSSGEEETKSSVVEAKGDGTFEEHGNDAGDSQDEQSWMEDPDVPEYLKAIYQRLQGIEGSSKRKQFKKAWLDQLPEIDGSFEKDAIEADLRRIHSVDQDLENLRLVKVIFEAASDNYGDGLKEAADISLRAGAAVHVRCGKNIVKVETEM